MNQEIRKTCKFQQVYKEYYKIFKERKSLLFSDFMKWVKWMQEIFNLITYQEEQRYNNIIKEYLSIRAQFIKNKEYIIIENDYISWVI